VIANRATQETLPQVIIHTSVPTAMIPAPGLGEISTIAGSRTAFPVIRATDPQITIPANARTATTPKNGMIERP